MPIYEYKCTNCEHQFELWQEVGAEAPVCPECGQAVKKIFHPVSVHYKGSGFYITDSRSKKEASIGGKSAESKNESKGDEKSSGADAKAPAQTDSASPSANSSADNQNKP